MRETRVFLSTAEARALLDLGATVIDARGTPAWATGHLAGSQPLAWTSMRQGWSPKNGHLSDDLGAIGAALGKAGVRADRPVLVVGAGGSGWGEEGRLWWTLAFLGHPEVYVLDGGMPAWLAAGLPRSIDPRGSGRGDFTPVPQVALRASASEIAGRDPARTVVWDSREDREFAGETPYGEARGGHIPGAAHLWFRELMDEAGLLRPATELLPLLATQGIVPEKRIIAACTGGVRSGFAVAAMVHLGFPDVANYDGSMWEWAADPARDLQSGR